MEIYNRAMFRSPESATEWLLKLIVGSFSARSLGIRGRGAAGVKGGRM